MKRVRLVFSTLTIGAVVSLMSCDPYGGYEYYINNQSDSTLYIVQQYPFTDSLSKLSLEPNAQTLILEYETINGLHDYGNDFLERLDSLGIFIDTVNITEIKKDYHHRSSWSYKQDATGMFGLSGDNIYTLKITDSDLK